MPNASMFRQHLALACSHACRVGALLAAACSAQAGINQWTSTGPDGGQVDAIQWHPTQAGVLLASIGGKVVRSTDSGVSWHVVSLQGGGATSFAFDPSNPNRVLAGGGPIQRSDDGGASFGVTAAPPGFSFVRHLAITPDGGAVYATTATSILRSTNFGETWTERAAGLPAPVDGETPTDLDISPADASTVYSSWYMRGIYRTTDAGLTWQPVPGPGGNVRQLAIDPRNAANLVAAAAGLWRSSDGGQNWNLVIGGQYSWVQFDPQVPDRVYAATLNGGTLLVSSNGGASWQTRATLGTLYVLSGAASPATAGALALATQEGVYISSDAGVSAQFRTGGVAANDLRAIVVSRSAPRQIYASFYAGREGVHRRTPAGWELRGIDSLRAAMLPEGSPIESLAVDPLDSNVIYAAGPGGVARSVDGGQTWLQPSSVFLGAQARSVATDAQQAQVVYAASPGRGILRTSNGGATWFERNTGLPTVSGVHSMSFVSVSPLASSLLFASQNGFGTVYRSVDAGLNWTAAGGGLPTDKWLRCVTYHPTDPNRLFICFHDSIYRTQDGGATWTAMPLPTNATGLMALTIDSQFPDTMALIAATAGGLLRTVDGGANWELIAYQPARDVPILLNAAEDPLVPGNYIAGASRASMLEFQVAPDLAVTLAGLPDRLALGATPTLTATVRNNGPYSTSSARLVLNLPAMLAAGTITPARGTCSRSGPQITCELGALRVAESVQVSVNLSATAGSGSATGTVSAHEADPATANNTAIQATLVQNTADLSVTLQGPQSLDHGADGSLALRVANAGPNTVSYVMDLQLPAGLSLVSVAGGPGTCTPQGTLLRCVAGALASGDATTFDVTVRASAVGMQNLALGVGATDYDPNAANNTANLSIAVRPVTDLVIGVTDAPATVRPNQNGSATITVTNTGADDAGIVVATLSGTNLEVLAATPATGTCAVSAGSANCSLGALAAGAGRAIAVTFVARANGSAQLAATTNFEGRDTQATNNTTSRSLNVIPLVDAGIAVAGASASLIVGQGGNATLTVTNGGPDEAPATVATISGTSLELQAVTSASGPCTINGGTATCALGSTPVGVTRTIDITVVSRAAGQASLTAAVSSGGTDAAGGNDSVTRAFTVAAPAPAPDPGGGSGGGSGGGGGSLDAAAVLALLAWVLGAAGIHRPRRTPPVS